jgi:MoxR-like ATPase
MALYRTAQARAAFAGRVFVRPDDVKYLAPFVLTHRIQISPQTRLRGRRPEDVIADLVDTIPVPVEH